jgi:DNA-nicking Smr family endonuclease
MSRRERRRAGLDPDDLAQWRRVARTVKPFAGRPAFEEFPLEAPPEPKPEPPPQAIAPARAKAPASPPDATPIDRRTRRRLARGHMEIDARIDLHGMRQSEAHRTLLAFLRHSHAAGRRFVLVITGKGSERAPDGPWWDGGASGVLRRSVPQWLNSPEFSGIVAGFDHAERAHGGTGALYIRLRRPRERP